MAITRVHPPDRETPLIHDTTLRALGAGSFGGEVPERWCTPRGPHGGYLMALVMRGLIDAAADPSRVARSLTVHFLRAAAPGEALIRTSVARSGRSMTTVTGTLEQRGAVLALGTAVFAAPGNGPERRDARMPSVTPPDGRPAPTLNREPPAYAQHLTMQPRFGSGGHGRSDRAETGGWLGLREPGPLDPVAIALLADAWIPTPWEQWPELGEIPPPTIEMSVFFRTRLPIPDTLLLAHHRTRLLHDGIFDEDGEFWTPDGTLVAQSRQLALLGVPRNGPAH